jgi:folate-dependent phosphoribosylglycinamide formyltransferase PurN
MRDWRFPSLRSSAPVRPALQIARERAVPTQALGRREFVAREEFDGELAARIERFQPHLVAVAVFMRILTAPLSQPQPDMW